jgi:tRNA U34 5-methylaminomethyl-2-thiouridine-forming methyltransferase MnmC
MTADGSDTIYDGTVNQHYHSTFGAIQESRFIFIEQGLLKALDTFCTNVALRSDSECTGTSTTGPDCSQGLKILEIGFGTGLNALLTLIEAEKRSTRVHYHSIESRPLPEEIWRRLNYPEQAGEKRFSRKFSTIHECPWDQPVAISDNLILHKIKTRFEEFTPNEAYFHLIYFDAFDPEAQPELWTASLFKKLYHALHPGGVLVTYSSKGLVKRALRDSGFRVERLPGPPGKRHMIRATRVS